MMCVLKGVVLQTLLLQALPLLRSNAQCLNVTDIAVEQLGLSEKQFWRAKSHDLEQCAQLCVRRKPCLSFNYDAQSHICELNAGTKADTPTKTGMYLMYSEIQWWPASVDVNCYSRPCQDSEVCIPGSLADGSPDCSYVCLKTVRDVCPMPEFGVSAGRTVGSVNVYTCSKGYTGGGSATCLASKIWDNEIDATCPAIHLHACTDDTLCSQIKASCSSNGKCECVGQYSTWDDTLKECALDCGDPPDVTNSAVSGNKVSQTYECNAGSYPTAGSVSIVNCTVNGWEPANSFSCYTCSNPPPAVAGASLSGSGNVRQYTCNSGLYQVPGTGDGSIKCTENSGWVQQTSFKCGGLNLKAGTGSSIVQRPYSGYLEMFVGGEWKAVTYKKWTWQATKVACKILFGFSYGGTWHQKWFDTINAAPLPEAEELDKLSCTGEEDAMEECYYEEKNGNIADELALTCFNYSFTTPDFEHVILQAPGQNIGVLLVKIDGEYGAICSSGWSDKHTEVACRSLKSTWTRSGECKDSCHPWSGKILTNHVKCEDDTPHLFYCGNKGWGYDTDCDDSKLVGIDCDTVAS